MPRRTLLLFLFFIDEWQREIADAWCRNNDGYRPRVNNQVECQELCFSSSTCVGIVYNSKEDSTYNCFLCNDDVLEPDNNQNNFYRRPGER